MKGWRRFRIADVGRGFHPTCRQRSLASAKREPGVHGISPSHEPGTEDLAEKDKPIDPTSGKNSPASPSPIRRRAIRQADGRQPFMPLRVSHDPCLQRSLPFRSCEANAAAFPSGALRAPFIQRLITITRFLITAKQLPKNAQIRLIGRCAYAYRAGGQGLPLNLTLGAPPIGRSESRDRPGAPLRS
jgi:hypothetical protein